jgi:hypothetical protein
VKRQLEATEPPRYSRAPAVDADRLEPVLRELLPDWPESKAPQVTAILRDGYALAALSRIASWGITSPGAVRRRRRTSPYRRLLMS